MSRLIVPAEPTEKMIAIGIEAAADLGGNPCNVKTMSEILRRANASAHPVRPLSPSLQKAYDVLLEAVEDENGLCRLTRQELADTLGKSKTFAHKQVTALEKLGRIARDGKRRIYVGVARNV